MHRETVAWCLEHNIVPTAYGSMGSSRNAHWQTDLDELNVYFPRHEL